MIVISAKDQLFLSHSSFQCLEAAAEHVVEMLHPVLVSGTPGGFLTQIRTPFDCPGQPHMFETFSSFDANI